MKGWIWMSDGWLGKDFCPCNMNMKRSYDFYLFFKIRLTWVLLILLCIKRKLCVTTPSSIYLKEREAFAFRRQKQ